MSDPAPDMDGWYSFDPEPEQAATLLVVPVVGTLDDIGRRSTVLVQMSPGGSLWCNACVGYDCTHTDAVGAFLETV